MTEDELKDCYFRLLSMAKENNEISREEYEELILEPIATLDEQETSFKKLINCLLLKKIEIGAAYIESLLPEHPNYQKACERYEYLIKSLEEIA